MIPSRCPLSPLALALRPLCSTPELPIRCQHSVRVLSICSPALVFGLIFTVPQADDKVDESHMITLSPLTVANTRCRQQHRRLLSQEYSLYPRPTMKSMSRTRLLSHWESPVTVFFQLHRANEVVEPQRTARTRGPPFACAASTMDYQRSCRAAATGTTKVTRATTATSHLNHQNRCLSLTCMRRAHRGLPTRLSSRSSSLCAAPSRPASH
jgi:hypothetical protein